MICVLESHVVTNESFEWIICENKIILRRNHKKIDSHIKESYVAIKYSLERIT